MSPESKKDIELFLWSPDDLEMVPRILKSSSQAHGNELQRAEWFLWKFGQSPWGPAVVACARSLNGRIAGVVAFGMYRLQHVGHDLRAGVSYETFVHPDFQKQGLFTKLLSLAEEEMKNRGALLLYNFPNSASKRGFLKRGWVDQGGIQTWIKPVNKLRILGKVALHRSFGSFQVEHVYKRDVDLELGIKRIRGTSASARDAGKVICRVHEKEFLMWRLAAIPTFHYSLVSSDDAEAIIRTGMRLGFREVQIMDIFFKSPLSILGFIKLIKKIARVNSADAITMPTTKGNPFARMLPLTGFLPVPNNVNFFAKALSENAPEASSSKNWAITGIDIHMW